MIETKPNLEGRIIAYWPEEKVEDIVRKHLPDIDFSFLGTEEGTLRYPEFLRLLSEIRFNGLIETSIEMSKGFRDKGMKIPRIDFYHDYLSKTVYDPYAKQRQIKVSLFFAPDGNEELCDVTVFTKGLFRYHPEFMLLSIPLKTNRILFLEKSGELSEAQDYQYDSALFREVQMQLTGERKMNVYVPITSAPDVFEKTVLIENPSVRLGECNGIFFDVISGMANGIPLFGHYFDQNKEYRYVPAKKLN